MTGYAKTDDADDFPLTLKHAIVLLKDDYDKDCEETNDGNNSDDEVEKLSVEHPARVILKHLGFGGDEEEDVADEDGVYVDKVSPV